ncbi:hypothetical protein RYX36_019776 [Vicia faba]
MPLFIVSSNFLNSEITEDTQSKESLKESEDVSSDETMKQEESLIILLLSIAFVSISGTNSPGIDHAVFGEFYEAYKLSELSAFARANLDQFSQFSKANYDCLARNLHIWFTKSLSLIPELISDVRGAQQLLSSEITADENFGDISAEHEVYDEEQLHHDIEMATGFDKAFHAPEFEEVHNGRPATIFELEERALQLSEIEHLNAKLAQEVDVEDPPIKRVKLLIQNQDELLKAGTLSKPYKGIGDYFY